MRCTITSLSAFQSYLDQVLIHLTNKLNCFLESCATNDSLLYVHATILLGCLTTPLAPRWDDLIVQQSWDTVLTNWDRLGLPPAGTTVDLHIALESRRENALTETNLDIQYTEVMAYQTLHIFYNTATSRWAGTIRTLLGSNTYSIYLRPISLR